MTLNHSKTWPVSTMAVVQLRVDLHGRTYSALPPPEAAPEAPLDDSHVAANGDGRRKEKLENGVVFPLSKKHLELFTKMSSAPALKTIRTDTVSTILEQDEFDSENQGSAGRVRRSLCALYFGFVYFGRGGGGSTRWMFLFSTIFVVNVVCLGWQLI